MLVGARIARSQKNTSTRIIYNPADKGRCMELKDFSKAEFMQACGLAAQLPKNSGIEFTFVGRSNVGKSSLINKLCGRKSLARVSGTPGKTATINFYAIGDAHLVDLPGYGYAKTSQTQRRRWDDLINGYFKQSRDIRLLLQLLDSRHAPSKDDVMMMEYLSEYKIPFVAVLTKADKFTAAQRNTVVDKFNDIKQYSTCKGVLLTSAEKDIGMSELRQILIDASKGQEINTSGEQQ